MKQCPTCSRTYANDKQKFCTQDGIALVDAHSASAGQGETVRIDSAELDDEITKAISKGLPRMTGSGFDPYKTTVSAPQETSAIPSQKTEAPRAQAPAAPPPVAPVPDQVAAAPVVPQPPVAPGPPAQAPASPPPVTIASPATNVPPPQVAAAAPVTPQVVPAAAVAPTSRPAKKRSKLPLILGLLFVLLLLGAGAVVAGYFFVLKPMLEAKRGAILEPRGPKPTPVVVTTPDVGKTKPETPKIEVPAYSPPAGAMQFVNSNANLTGKLAEHYVDFSFYYPKGWQRDPKSGVAGATNFVQVERSLPPNYTLENYAVGWYSSAGSAEADRTAFSRLAENLSAKFEKTIDNYRKVSEQETKIGAYDAYEFRFAGRSQPTDKGQFEIWGVAVFVPPVDGGKDGVTLLMLATSLAPELRSVNDVGVKGELPMMLESFRFGK
ncbi:MAG TPA: hypothetical protein DC054_23170 [Blastocatellia bacterium]|nr:hypothetical protein [Blastocatellia bacterium]